MSLAPGSLTGTYSLTNLDGSPILPGYQAEMKVFAGPFPCSIGVICVDNGDGPIVVEVMLICPNKEDYTTKNKDGNDGKITPKGDGVYETEITSGPNEGAKRKLVKLP